MERFTVCQTLGGGYHGYGIEDRISYSPWPKRFNLTLEEAEELVKVWNKKKPSWWTKFWLSKELKDLEEKKE